MPIRFQVDPDFYDHPKTTGMSDAAFSLWVRAGSYSAAKTTDGFVNEDVLVYTLRSNVEVADELVSRGLWRRRKGGFQFHQWEVRNLTRERVEADRKTDRERKRGERKAAKSHVDREIVRPDTSRTPDGTQPESERNPPVSVSVSVSESVSGSGQPPTRPPDRCPQHATDERPPPCGACAAARETRQTWDTRNRAAIRACTWCDGDGWRWDPAGRHRGPSNQRCNHTPPGRAP